MTDWNARLAIGTDHEDRVVVELDARSWAVHRTGQGTYPAAVREALRRSDSQLRQFPDMIAARGSSVVAIDAKTSMSSRSTGRYAISRTCLHAGLQFVGLNAPIPLYYVFGDLRVLTPSEIASYSDHRLHQTTGAYYLISTDSARHFDDVFGSAAGIEAA